MRTRRPQVAGIPPASGFIALAVVSGFLLAACQGPPAHSKRWRRERSAADDTTAPVAGTAAALAEAHAQAMRERAHTLRIRLESEPAHLNPLVDPDLDTLRVAEDTVFESLLRYAPGPALDGPGVLTPQLAESYRVLGGGTEIRVLVRDDVKFHDGTRFAVTDAQYSLDMARSSAVRAPRLREALSDVISIDLVGPRELRLALRKPNAYVLRALAEIPMLPEHVYRAGTTPGSRPIPLDRHPKNRAPVGTGPYRFVRWDKGARIVLARNVDYWGKPPAIDDLEFVVEPDAAKALMRAKRGELDVVPALAPVHYPDQANAMQSDFQPLRLRPPRLRYVVVNLRRPPLDDVRVRQALALLVDRRKLTAELNRGMVRAVAGPVWPGGPGDAPSPATPAFDPAAAGELLTQAGWTDTDGDGVRELNGQKLRVVLLSGSDARGDAERDLLVGGLRKAGFAVEVRSGDPAVLLNRLKSGDFELAMIDWRARSDEDLDALVSTGGARNWGGYSSKAMDAAIAAAEAAWEPATRVARVAEIGRLMATDWPIVPMYAADPIGLVHRRVRGLVVRDGWFAIRALSFEPAGSSK
jgi:peptide/nickel transport system substrate-binding protein